MTQKPPLHEFKKTRKRKEPEVVSDWGCIFIETTNTEEGLRLRLSAISEFSLFQAVFEEHTPRIQERLAAKIEAAEGDTLVPKQLAESYVDVFKEANLAYFVSRKLHDTLSLINPEFLAMSMGMAQLDTDDLLIRLFNIPKEGKLAVVMEFDDTQVHAHFTAPAREELLSALMGGEYLAGRQITYTLQ